MTCMHQVNKEFKMIMEYLRKLGPLQHSPFSPTANADDGISLVNDDHDGTDPEKNI